MRKFNLFPFSDVEKGSKVAIYGAGTVGQDYVKQISETGFCCVAFVADKNFANLSATNTLGMEVLNPTVFIDRTDFDYVLIATIYEDYRDEMVGYLVENGVAQHKIISKLMPIKVSDDVTYSQHGEDLIIYNAFKHLGYFKDGKLPTYIDVGAHHPYNISNTALFHQFGCHGVNIEANPVLIKEFEKERPHDINLCVGIGAQEGVFPFYISDVMGLNTFKKENLMFNEFLYELDTGIKKDYKANEVIHLPIKRLDDVINEYCKGVWPDFMSIDIEGMEYESLNACDLSQGPALIAVEVNFDGDLFIEMLGAKGYFPYLWYRENILFARNELEHLLHAHQKRGN